MSPPPPLRAMGESALRVQDSGLAVGVMQEHFRFRLRGQRAVRNEGVYCVRLVDVYKGLLISGQPWNKLGVCANDHTGSGPEMLSGFGTRPENHVYLSIFLSRSRYLSLSLALTFSCDDAAACCVPSSRKHFNLVPNVDGTCTKPSTSYIVGSHLQYRQVSVTKPSVSDALRNGSIASEDLRFASTSLHAGY